MELQIIKANSEIGFIESNFLDVNQNCHALHERKRSFTYSWMQESGHMYVCVSTYIVTKLSHSVL